MSELHLIIYIKTITIHRIIEMWKDIKYKATVTNKSDVKVLLSLQ